MSRDPRYWQYLRKAVEEAVAADKALLVGEERQAVDAHLERASHFRSKARRLRSATARNSEA